MRYRAFCLWYFGDFAVFFNPSWIDSERKLFWLSLRNPKFILSSYLSLMRVFGSSPLPEYGIVSWCPSGAPLDLRQRWLPFGDESILRLFIRSDAWTKFGITRQTTCDQTFNWIRRSSWKYEYSPFWINK